MLPFVVSKYGGDSVAVAAVVAVAAAVVVPASLAVPQTGFDHVALMMVAVPAAVAAVVVDCVITSLKTRARSVRCRQMCCLVHQGPGQKLEGWVPARSVCASVASLGLRTWARVCLVV